MTEKQKKHKCITGETGYCNLNENNKPEAFTCETCGSCGHKGMYWFHCDVAACMVDEFRCPICGITICGRFYILEDWQN